MRVLLHKTVRDLADTIIETVSGIERTLGTFAKVLGKGGGQRQLGPAEAVNGLPVVTYRKQAGLFILFTQRCQ
ncbi:hypothetical protein D3C72_1644750 [compost metagenome]